MMMNQPDTRMFTTELRSLNHSGDLGRAIVEVNGNQATFKVHTTNTSPNLPHAQHLHFEPSATNPGFCPDNSADANSDGFISALEGVPSYGPVHISLTTSGDFSPMSGLAVDRFPVSDENGVVTYERTITLPDTINAGNIDDGVIVQHGISELFDDHAAYDGVKRSSLDATLPFEASVPASCGALTETTEVVVTPPVDEEAPVDEDDTTVMPVAPVVNMDTTESATTFDMAVVNALNELSDDEHAMVADEFSAAYLEATSKFEQTVATAASMFNSSDDADMQPAKNLYIDTFNNAKATYFNELDIAKNQLAIALSGKDDVAKDMFMNKYNQVRDAYGNQLEMLKNDFAAEF